jgi:hypothetical protein
MGFGPVAGDPLELEVEVDPLELEVEVDPLELEVEVEVDPLEPTPLELEVEVAPLELEELDPQWPGRQQGEPRRAWMSSRGVSVPQPAAPSATPRKRPRLGATIPRYRKSSIMGSFPSTGRAGEQEAFLVKPGGYQIRYPLVARLSSPTTTEGGEPAHTRVHLS